MNEIDSMRVDYSTNPSIDKNLKTNTGMKTDKDRQNIKYDNLDSDEYTKDSNINSVKHSIINIANNISKKDKIDKFDLSSDSDVSDNDIRDSGSLKKDSDNSDEDLKKDFGLY